MSEQARRPLVAGNWKMNGSLTSNAERLLIIRAALDRLNGIDVVLCPPYPYLAQLGQELAGSTAAVGAQDASRWAPSGAYTGEVSAPMLADLGCGYVIVGHSERRGLLAESDALVAEKFEQVQAAGLIPILCVGETLAEREAEQTLAVVLRQLQAVIARLGIAALENSVLAYEPVWAIGTGRTASPAQAQEVHAQTRGFVAQCDAKIADSLRILYGGSVKPDNADELFAAPDIDGGLIGGAALDAQAFLAICAAAQRTVSSNG